jgi:Mn2+/Fe2+ NRAMP family transporter
LTTGAWTWFEALLLFLVSVVGAAFAVTLVVVRVGVATGRVTPHSWWHIPHDD